VTFFYTGNIESYYAKNVVQGDFDKDAYCKSLDDDDDNRKFLFLFNHQ